MIPITEITPTHADLVRNTSEQVLTKDIPWEGYQRANLINARELELIKSYDKKPEETRKQLIIRDGETYSELFLELLLKINKEETFHYLLCMIDQVLSEYPDAVKLFLKLSSRKPSFPLEPFLRILNRSTSDWFTNAKTSSILALLMSKSNEVSEQNVKFMCHWIRSQLRASDEKDISNGVNAAQIFLRRDEFRQLFAADDGILLLASLLKNKSKSHQLTYMTLLAIWLLTYNHEVASKVKETRLISYVVDILRNVPKEKVIRLSLSTLVNLLNHENNNELMLESNIMKPLELLSNKQWGDEDIVSDIQTLKESLEKNLVQMSSFDMYKREVTSGALEWSPVHKSEKFWKENSYHFEEDNYKILLLLKQYLTLDIPNPLVTSVACHDIGEFARHHPRGRHIVQQLGIKIPLMQLMEDKDQEVKKQALNAVQKLMVHNWEFLM